MHRSIKAFGAAALVATIAASGAGCGGSTTPTGPGPVLAPPPASVEVLTGLTTAIQTEYKSQATYARVIADFGSVLPFATIVMAEETHVSSVAALFTSRSLPVPGSEWNSVNVPAYATVREACAGAAANERENVALYDALLATALPRDVGQVYANLRAASLNNHLPAFEACS
jgi:hypothetical protein